MSSTLLRLGLWTLILVLSLYVIHETYSDQHWAEMIPTRMLQQALVVSGILIAAGIALRVLGVGAKAVTKNRCRVCKTPIAVGAMFCRAHLRTILSDEDDKTHMTKVRR